MHRAAVALIDPKIPYNVAAALRACSLFGADTLAWTGERVRHPDTWAPGTRLPREERMKLYKDVQLDVMADAELVDDFYIRGFIPVAVEKRLAAEPLDSFVHPEQAVYVFGPEDGSLTPGLLHSCHRFVCIPTVSKHAPLNLAGAVNVVLYDRYAKERRTINERLLKTVGQDS